MTFSPTEKELDDYIDKAIDCSLRVLLNPKVEVGSKSWSIAAGLYSLKRKGRTAKDLSVVDKYLFTQDFKIKNPFLVSEYNAHNVNTFFKDLFIEEGYEEAGVDYELEWREKHEIIPDDSDEEYLRFIKRMGERLAFDKYHRFMQALGLGKNADDFFQYGLYEEELNTEPSLNMTASITEIDGERLACRFVKFYDSEERCKKDMFFTGLLNGFMQHHEWQKFVDLRQADIGSVTETLSKEHSRRKKAFASEIRTHYTTSEEEPKSRLEFALVTELFEGATLEQVLAGMQDEEPDQVLKLFKRVIDHLDYTRSMFANKEARDMILAELHDYLEIPQAFDVLTQNAPLDNQYTRIKNYAATTKKALCGEGEPNEEANNVLKALEPVFSTLQKFVTYDRLAYGDNNLLTRGGNRSRYRYVSFVHGDLHPRNMIEDNEWGWQFYDFERSSFGLKAEDLNRIYQEAEKFGLGEEVKDYYFRKSFGDNYDKEECEAMFRMTRALYYIETVPYYDFQISDSDGEQRDSWKRKKARAKDIVVECLQNYIPQEDMDTVVEVLWPESQSDQEAA